MDLSFPQSHLSVLSGAEKLLLRTTRALALGIRCHSFRVQFELACGWGGSEAFRALAVFVAQVGLKGRRRLRIALPGVQHVDPDEILLLEVFATAQAEDYRDLDITLERLLGCEPQRPLAAAACLVAETLTLNGLVLPGHRAPVSAIPACPLRETAHQI